MTKFLSAVLLFLAEATQTCFIREMVFSRKPGPAAPSPFLEVFSLRHSRPLWAVSWAPLLLPDPRSLCSQLSAADAPWSCFESKVLITRAFKQPDLTEPSLFQPFHYFTICTFTCIRPGSFFFWLFTLPVPCLSLCFFFFFLNLNSV